MKKRISCMIMVLGIAMALAGCSGGAKDTNAKDTNKEGTAATEAAAGKEGTEGADAAAGKEGTEGADAAAGKESTAAAETADSQEQTEQAPEVSTDAQAAEGAQEMIRQAGLFAEDIIAGDYDKVKSDFTYDDEFKEVLDSGQIEQAMVQSVGASGKLVEIKEGFVSSESGQYINVEVPCDFETADWNMAVTFTGDGKITGLHIAQYKEGMAQAPDGVKETSLKLKINQGRELPGTLTEPENKSEYAAVVFVHGSGSSDRNESSGSLKPFQDLAWGLAQKGIASYRYDKISYVYGKELAADKDFTVYDETVNDAAAAVQMLREQKGVTRVYVVGHSQGGQMMGAIAKEGNPDGCIMMAAPSSGFAENLERQIQYLKSLSPNPTEEEKALYDTYEKAIESMKNIDSLGEDEVILGQRPSYFKSILDYDAVEEARGITVPVLALQGEEDYQVTMDDFGIWKENFQDKENWSFQSFPGLTHMFMTGKYENGSADYAGEKHIPDEVVASIADFIEK